jgi:cytoskeleton protein RodZ
MPGGSSSRWPILAGIAAVVFLGAALVDVLWPETPPNDPAVVASAPPPPAAPPAPAAAPAPAVPAETAPPSAAATPGAPEPAAAVPATFRQDAERGRPLRLEFAQASWVQVKDASGKVVLEALFQPGTSRELNAEPPLTLIIGNAPGVRLTYGDKPVDLAPHTRVAVARLTLE